MASLLPLSQALDRGVLPRGLERALLVEEALCAHADRIHQFAPSATRDDRDRAGKITTAGKIERLQQKGGAFLHQQRDFLRACMLKRIVVGLFDDSRDGSGGAVHAFGERPSIGWDRA